MDKSPPNLRRLPAWCLALLRRAEVVAQLPRTPCAATDLARQTGLTPRALTPHLLIAGWHRERVWGRRSDGRRRLTVWWLPPGTQAPRTPRGRPRSALSLPEALRVFNPPKETHDDYVLG